MDVEQEEPRRNPGEPSPATHLHMIFIRLDRINRPVLEIKAGEDYIRFPSTTFRASNPTLERVKNKTENFMLERLR